MDQPPPNAGPPPHQPPPPPPPPHGQNPKSTSSGLPPGNYDIFIVPPHSAGAGFVYLPSLKPHLNSFAAGVVSTLLVIYAWVLVQPIPKAWVQAVSQSGSGFGMMVLVLLVGFGGWVYGRAALPASPGHESPKHNGAPPPQNGYANGTGPPPKPAPGPQWGTGPNPQAGPGPGFGTHGHQGAGYGGRTHAEYEQQQYYQRPPTPPPQPFEDVPPKQTRPPTPEPKPRPYAPSSSGSAWEKARGETRKREEEKKRQEEIRRKEEEERRKKEQADREARAAAEKQRWEQLRAREKEARERELREKQARERIAKEKEELAAKLAREEEERKARLKAAQEELAAKLAKEEEERKARLKAAQEELAAKQAKEEEERKARLKEAQERAEELAAKQAKEDEERKARLKAAQERAEKLRADRAASERAASERAKSEKAIPTYGVGERTNPYAVESMPAPPKSAIGVGAARREERPTTPYQHPTAQSYAGTATDTAFRPYDKQRKPKETSSQSSYVSSSSYAASESTAPTTPPASFTGPYSTNDPEKVVIHGAFKFNDSFPNGPTASVRPGDNYITDGLIMRINTEGVFLDDDRRGEALRQWDIKAWTLTGIETVNKANYYLVRASVRSIDNLKHVYIVPAAEQWKVSAGLKRLRGGSLLRSTCSISSMSNSDASKLLGMVGAI